MVKITKNGDKAGYGVKEFIADTTADVANLPDSNETAPGSTCLVAGTGDVYIMNASGNWVQL